MFLFLPGFLCNEAVFQHQIHAFQGVVSDYKGSSTIQEMAQTSAELVPSNKVKALVAFSMGGYVALEIMKHRMLSVDLLVLIGTMPSPRNAQDTISLKKKAQSSEFKYKMPMAYIEQAFCNYNSKTYELMADMTSKVSVNLLTQCNAIINRPDHCDSLDQITSKTLIISGTEDRIINCKESIEMSKKIPNSQLALLENIGHFVTLEAPFEVNRLIREVIYGY